MLTSPRLRRIVVTTVGLVGAGLGGVGATGAGLACSAQGEGQRCNTENGDDDCADGLQCFSAPSILGEVCCPTDGTATDPACLDDTPAVTVTTTTGAGGAGGAGGSGGAGGAGATATTAGAGGGGGAGGS